MNEQWYRECILKLLGSFQVKQLRHIYLLLLGMRGGRLEDRGGQRHEQ